MIGRYIILLLIFIFIQPSTAQQLSSQTVEDQKIGLTQLPESEIFAAINPIDTQNIIVSSMRFTPQSATQSLSFSLYSSTDFGSSWIENSFRGSPEGNNNVVGGGDPLLIFDRGGTAHFIWLLNTINPFSLSGKQAFYYATSEDKGLSWKLSNRPIIETNILFDSQSQSIVPEAKLIDKPWLAIDRSQGNFSDQLYLVYVEQQFSPDSSLSIQCQRKGRLESRFNPTQVQVNFNQYSDLQFPTATVDPDGNLHIAFWASTDGINYALYHSSSIDGARTFIKEKIITKVAFPPKRPAQAFPDSPIIGVERIYPAPQILADNSEGPAKGRIYMSWAGLSDSLSSNFNIFLSWSDDQGNTWNSPITIGQNTDGAIHQFHPTAHITDQGQLLMSWYQQQSGSGQAKTDFLLSQSNTQRIKFEKTMLLNSSSADFKEIGLLNNNFGIGEYTSIVSSPHYAFTFWADGRLGNGSVSIYASKIRLTEEIPTSSSTFQVSNAVLNLELYPNPIITGEQLTLEFYLTERAAIGIEIIDQKGRKLHDKTPASMDQGSQTMDIELPPLSRGTYWLRLNTATHSLSRPFIIH